MNWEWKWRKRGFFADVYACDTIASWLCELGRWIFQDVVRFFFEAERVDGCSLDSYSNIIDEYRDMRNDLKLYNNIQDLEYIIDR